MTPEAYAAFLDRLTSWAASHPDVIGLVGLGSTAGTTHRPDEYSDHDVWIVTRDGAAAPLRDDVSWLPAAERIVMVFHETEHGRGVLYDDGHLVELAVFDDHELEIARLNAYRVLVDRGGIAERLAAMADRSAAPPDDADPDGTRRFHEWVVQVVVALGRFARGEALSASSRVRGRAMTDLLSLIADVVPAEQPASLDDLDPHRRFERAYPVLGARLNAALEAPLPHTVAEMLDVVETHFLGRVPAVTPEVIGAVRTVLERTRG